MKFDNVIGNSEVKNYLRKNIETSNILHSYLFIGTEGIGKFLIAKEFSKYILCLENSKENCKCKSCLCYDGNNHPDFKIINETGETIKIEQIRELVEKVIEKPIDSNQNCLLKTLEEPPEFFTMILITSNENMILNTIKSRCMKVKFKNIENKILYDYAINEIGYEDISENLLKTFGGSIRKAINLKENKEKYKDIDTLMNKMKTDDIISIFLTSKFMYDKEKIFEILDYLTVCLYSKAKEDKRYLNCLKYVSESTLRLKSNGNFDMNVDSLLFNIWEELNEKGNRS